MIFTCISNWDSLIIQTSLTTDMMCYIRFEQSEKLNFIDSELDAIERTTMLREINEKVGIIKGDEYYEGAKEAIMFSNDNGIRRTEECFFRDENGQVIIINYN